MKGRVHSIETFGTVDGPGVRFVVFLQGCPMRCSYCHNPDTWEMQGGELTGVEEILDQYESSRSFYKNGGLTVTGGEPLMQASFVLELFTQAKNRGIHTCLDTSGVTFLPDKPECIERFDEILEVTDLILLDLKHIDEVSHKTLTAHGNKNILAFARYLARKDMPVWVRHVVVPGITDKEEDLYHLGLFIGELSNVKALDVLPYHDMGKVKYKKLGMDYPLEEIEPLSKEEALKAKKIILRGIKEKRGKN